MLDRETAQKYSKELKIDLFTIYREYLQLLFLKYFYRKKETSGICLKGGTAIRFIYESFRFSEDLDFSSMPDRDVLKKLISDTLNDLKTEGLELRFKESETLGDSFTGRIFQDLDKYNIPLTIKLDFSVRERPIEVETSLIETLFPVTPYPVVNHLSAKEILAEKIRAFLTRAQGRDVFDIWFLLSKKVQMDEDLINKKMRIYDKAFDHKSLVLLIKDFPEKELKRDLLKFLPLGQREIIGAMKGSLVQKLKTYKGAD